MRILVTGSSGLLGGWLVAAAHASGEEPIGLAGPSAGFDVSDTSAVEAAFRRVKPDVVVHAAVCQIADCARDPDRARRINVEGTRNVATHAALSCARFIYVSTDLVFGGEEAPYREGDEAAPTSIYGATKLEAEAHALSAADAAIVRVPLLFGPTRTARRGFFDAQLATLREGKELTLFDDEWRTPLSLRAAAEALLAIARSTFRGIIHVGGPERMSRLEMGERLALHLGLQADLLIPSSRTSMVGEPRPRDVSLDRSLFDASFRDVARASFEDECAQMLGSPSP